MKLSRQKKQKEKIIEPSVYLKNNLVARTNGQKHYIRAINENKLVVCLGPAGTGKTYIAVAKAILGLHEKLYERIVITRPMVQAGERTGFLPGDILDKLQPYLQPIYDEMRHYISSADIQNWLNQSIIEIVPFAYMRGRNFHHSFVIADECQNATEEQLFMLATRYCTGSKFILTGDFTQSDLPYSKRGALQNLANYINEVPEVSIVTLTEEDIVRDKLVEDIVIARKNYYDKKGNPE